MKSASCLIERFFPPTLLYCHLSQREISTPSKIVQLLLEFINNAILSLSHIPPLLVICVLIFSV